MKVKIRWATIAETSYEKTFEMDAMPETIRRAIEERYEDQYPPFDVDLELSELDIDDADELAEYEDDDTETSYDCTDRNVEGIRVTTPTRAELGVPGVVHVHEAVDELLGSDDLAAAGDAYRDEEPFRD